MNANTFMCTFVYIESFGHTIDLQITFSLKGIIKIIQ